MIDLEEFQNLDALEAAKTIAITVRKLVRGEMPMNQAQMIHGMLETLLECMKLQRATVKEKVKAYTKAQALLLKAREQRMRDKASRARAAIKEKIQ